MSDYGPEFDAYAKRIRAELVPMIEDSACTVSIVPSGEVDIKFAVELGVSIMLDKPIIAVVAPGAKVPAKLVAVADRILEVDPSDPAAASTRLNEVLEELLGQS